MNNLATSVFLITTIIFSIIGLIGTSLYFQKVGYSWWKAFIPVYNFFVIFKIINVNPWLMILGLLPFVNIVLMAGISYRLARSFGKDKLFALGLFLLYPFFSIILGLTKNEYKMLEEV